MLLLRVIVGLYSIITICNGSYLDYPRIHFSGKFLANTNTINNANSNFKISLPLENLTMGWNPTGGNEWSLEGCIVTSVVYLNGSSCREKNIEPLIGASVHSNPQSVQGKLVSIDVDAGNKSILFGATLGVKQNAVSGEFAFMGSFLPNSVLHQNLWVQLPCASSKLPLHDTNGARSVSKLTNIQWARVLQSEVLQQLRQVSMKYRGKLSISMTMHDFVHGNDAGNFSYGFVSGSIGPARPKEAHFFEGERLLSFEFVDQPHLSLPESDPCSKFNHSPLWAYRAPFKVHPRTKTLTIDFSSSFSRHLHGGIRDLDVIYVAILPTKGCVETIGTIPYQEDRCRKINGCVMDYYLKSSTFLLIQTNPLVVVRNYSSTATTHHNCGTPPPLQHEVNPRLMTSPIHHNVSVVLLEQQYYVRPYGQYVFMLEKGEIATVDLFVTSLGQPAVGKTIQVKLANPTVKPINGLSYNHEATVDQLGHARFVFRASSIRDYPRQEYDLDGQVYQFYYFVKGQPTFCAGDIIHAMGTVDGNHTCVEMITIKVFSDVSYGPGQYNWVDHVQPIFFQYARLYPVMKSVVDLANYGEVTKPHIIHLVNFSMQLDISHPNHMPVLRDLSSTKRNMILEWLTKPCYNSTHCILVGETAAKDESHGGSKSNDIMKHNIHDNICSRIGSFHQEPHDFSSYYKNSVKFDVNAESYDCIRELKQSGCSIYVIQYCLQKAFELEFYTIPLYLTSLYSIKDGYNAKVYNIIRSVLMQEMLHMLQTANLLISIGGRPIINSASTAPAYPATGLPGGVFPHLTVSLKKASLDHIYSVFMAIEYPHRVNDVELGINVVHTRTIGQLYAEIGKCLHILGDEIFYPNRTSLQVKWPYSNDYGNVYTVNDLASAMEAIKEITEQGEGVQPGVPLGYKEKSLAHFFKFQEIVCGRELVFHSISNYTYTGAPITFNDDGVWPMRNNPTSVGLTPGTKVYHQTKNFHQTYRTLLKKLDDIFAGNPGELSEALAIMGSLEVKAKLLMVLPVNETDPLGETSGPVFDYIWD